MPQQLSPDTALLALGWERNAETDRYRWEAGGMSDWLTHNEAVSFAGLSPAPVVPPVETDDPSIRVLLQRILETLQHIDETLGRIPTKDATAKSGIRLCNGSTAEGLTLSSSGTVVYTRTEDMPQSTPTDNADVSV